MPSIDLSDDGLELARLVFGLHVCEVYDDPWDMSAADFDTLSAACAAFGLDPWDPNSVRAACGLQPTDYEANRLAAYREDLS